MENFGYLQDKLDIKILILFLLRRLPDVIEPEKLYELITRSGTVGYFDYVECLTELEATGHVQRQEAGCRITEKGVKGGAIIENSLPYTIRSKAEAAAAPVAASMRRSAMIKAGHRKVQGGWTAELGLEDGLGEMLYLRLLVSSEDMTRRMEQNFRRDPEGVYGRIVALLGEGEKEG
ncbi:MAG: DUF4364 family protein [Firmicutes bacterium]|nr:DUF4364 family protein [Bacillota bacterium]